MQFKFKVFLVACLFLVLSACASSLAVQSDFDTQYNLSSYKTFSVISPSLADQEEEISINPILIQRIARSIESNLSNKGLSKSEDSQLSVRFYLGSKREIERSTDIGGYGYYSYRYFDSRDQRYIRSDNDEIAIRVYDNQTGDVVWYAFTRLKRPSEQYNQSSVDSLVEEILSSFN